ncbi:Protein MAIN-LIKE 2 [Linum perenne]
MVPGKATITLENVEVLIGLPTTGLPVLTGQDDRSTSDICAQWLGVAPPPRAITGTTVKVSWVKGLLDHLPVEATPEVVTFDARAYTWVLELAFYWLTGVEITYRCTSYHLLGTRWLHPPTAGVGGSSMAV